MLAIQIESDLPSITLSSATYDNSSVFIHNMADKYHANQYGLDTNLINDQELRMYVRTYSYF